jgi:hypothetical protein
VRHLREGSLFRPVMMPPDTLSGTGLGLRGPLSLPTVGMAWILRLGECLVKQARTPDVAGDDPPDVAGDDP